ncbi:MAG TPA: universal stress protein [Streptosporangiaceae bacterium]|nr:universal stress protein [Streptosporangiaceae bacterium]
MNAAANPRRVVLGLDGSPNSVAALHRAVAETARLGGTLDAVLVLPASAGPEAYAAGLRMLAGTLSHEYPHGPGVPVNCVVDHGRPADVLVRLADGARLLVLGAWPDPEAGDVIGGGVVAACLSRVRCPLAVCAGHGQPTAA